MVGIRKASHCSIIRPYLKKSVVNHLNQLTLHFYEQIGAHFDATRQHHWPGWWQLHDKISEHLKANQNHLSVFDVGCGNGRFGTFLLSNFSELKLDFTGVDSDTYLLLRAKVRLEPASSSHFETVDLIEHILNKEPLLKSEHTFDLITLFGVQHHIPGFENRVELLKAIRPYLKKSGLFVMTCWQFTQLERFKNRTIEPSIVGLNAEDLESNDYLLDWKGETSAIRYCHLTTLEEATQMLQKSGFRLLDSFEADSEFNNGNLYILAELADLSK